MKLTIGRDVFAEAVTWTARALASRPPVPVLAGILIEAASDGEVRFSGFDYETSARTTVAAEIADPGRVLVSGRLLADIVRSLPAKPVDLVTEGTRVVLRCGASRFTLLTMPVEEYPSIPVVPETSGSIRADVFAQAVAQVAVAASRDETLPLLTAVRLEFDGPTVTMLATDRYRLALRTLPWTPDSDLPVPATLVRARTLAEVGKAVAAGSDLVLGVGPDHVGFLAGGRRTTSLTLGGEYPKVRSLFPASSSCTAVVDTAELEAGVRRVALVAERHTPVRLSFRDGTVDLEAGAGEDAQAVEAVDGVFDGDGAFVVAFNPQFLLDGLGALGTQFARFEFTEPGKPAVVSGQTAVDGGVDGSFRYLLMPVRTP